MSILCSNCDRDNQKDAQYCDACGVELLAATLFHEGFLSDEEDLDIEMSTKDLSSNLTEKLDELDDTIQHKVEKSLNPPAPMGLPTCLESDEPVSSSPVNSPPTAVESPQAALICQDTDTRYELPVEETTINIGRVNEQFPIHIDLTNIAHASLISRIHASIHWEQNRYYLEDVGSSNGTWLNGKPIKPGTRFRQEIRDRDTIAFGRSQTVKFTVELN
ncbi:FHA domain-containing protein [Waterburya agarophytonicola K14]|uniref:FHA domain-containing protein n=1 Tax=Waterburya agarophytonicola KI4 TaxID=2874699 RepID=A0A964FGD1_9CYAN|nr:FHA domain-containing protein [Waterburya agarophytonicola]MCC0176459.1 FHA domain-containing protein [Waterburya agarophytonicola KI4]